jgi:hypothetical protein
MSCILSESASPLIPQHRLRDGSLFRNERYFAAGWPVGVHVRIRHAFVRSCTSYF